VLNLDHCLFFWLCVEEVSGDVLFPRGLATTGTCTYSRKSSGVYFGVMEASVRMQNGFEEFPES
jgi:hypothetical protein